MTTNDYLDDYLGKKKWLLGTYNENPDFGPALSRVDQIAWIPSYLRFPIIISPKPNPILVPTFSEKLWAPLIYSLRHIFPATAGGQMRRRWCILLAFYFVKSSAGEDCSAYSEDGEVDTSYW